MSEGLKKQLEVIKEQQLKIDEMKKLILEDFVKESERVESMLVYANEIATLEELVSGVVYTYSYAISKPLRTTLLNLAKVTKLTVNQYGSVSGDIPSSLTKKLKEMRDMRPVYSTNVEANVFIGIRDDSCTEFSISGNNALQYALDNFVVDCDKYKAHLKKRIRSQIIERDRYLKNQNAGIKKMNKTLLLLENHKVSE